MRHVKQWVPSCILTLTTFEEFITGLGAVGDVAHVTLICGDPDWATAERIRQQYKCTIWSVPCEMLQTVDTWGVRWNGSVVWSVGV